MTIRRAVVSLVILASGLLAAAQSGVWDPDLFFALDGCIPVIAPQSLKPGDRLTIVAADRDPAEVVIESVRPPGDVPECGRRFKELQLLATQTMTAVAQAVMPDDLRHEALFAIAMRQDRRIVGGEPSLLGAAERDRLARIASASLPAEWRAKNVLSRGRRFGSQPGPVIVELYLGIPELNTPGAAVPIRAIRIQRVFMIGDRTIAKEEYERESGREERVDTEPPRLTLDNWSDSDTDRTVAFISGDDARSWTRLSTNVGFEGIWWTAEALRPGLPRTSEMFLYTPH